MPDLDGRLSALRDELRATVSVPDVASVAERHQQRRVRRRMQIGAAVAVLVVSAAVPLLRQLDAEPPPATPPPAPSTSATTPEDHPFLSQIKFADADNGYALRADCGEEFDYETAHQCQLILFGTSNGESWSRIGDVPQPPESASGLGDLSVLGPDRIAVDWFLGGEPNDSRTTRVYSDDGGHTWRNVPVPAEVTDETAEIPEGARLAPTCVGGRTVEGCDQPGVIVLLPDSGTSARLANQPNLEAITPGEIPTADGHWWIAGQQPGQDTWSLAVSTDDGRSWRTTELSWPGTINRWSVVSQDGTLYASATQIMGEDDDGLLAVFRSDDDGRTWQLVWQPTAETSIPSFDGVLVAAADGSVTANQFGAHHDAYTSTDGGHTFTTSDRRRFNIADWTGAGYLSCAEITCEISSNGVDWRQFDIPPV